jgi:hypothetical protein
VMATDSRSAAAALRPPSPSGGALYAPGTSRRCTHNRRAPRLEPVRRVAQTHWLSKEAIELLLAQWPLRNTKDDRLHSLLKRATGRRSKAKKKQPTKFTIKQKKSARIEAVFRILIFALEHVDYGDTDGLLVGIWNEEEARIGRPYTLEELARATDLARPSQRYEGKMRSSCRLDRALRDLAGDCAGFIHRHQSRDCRPDDQWAGKVAQLKLTYKFYEELGIPRERLGIAVREARERRAAHLKKAARKAPVAPVGAVISAALEPALRDLRPALPWDLPEADVPAFHWFCDQLRDHHPEWSNDQVRDEALRQLARRRKPPPQR